MNGAKYRSVKTVSSIHGLWGISILAFPLLGLEMPRPFGSQEAFLQYLPDWGMATLLLTGAIVCFLGLKERYKHPFFAVYCVVPQQLLLMWAFMWGVVQLIESIYERSEIDTRGWLALCYLFSLSLFHALDISDLWKRAFRKEGQVGNGA